MILLLYKNTFVKIKKSLGRYLSLFIIILFGVGVYAGLMGSGPDILTSVDGFYKEHKLLDFDIVSTLGLTEEDVEIFRNLSYVDKVVPSYTLDVLAEGNAIRLHAIEEEVNGFQLIEGRLPQSELEVLGDSRKYKIDDQINITSSISDKLKNSKFTVVGIIQSPVYMAIDYGSTTVGDGTLNSFLFIQKENFILEAYTNIYLTATDTNLVEAYTSEYNQISNLLKEEIKGIQKERETARYDSIVGEANDVIRDNEQTLQLEKADGEKQLSEAKAELEESAQKLQDGNDEILLNESMLEATIEKQNKEFDDGKRQIRAGWKEIENALSVNGIQKDEISEKILSLENGIDDLKAQQSQLPVDSILYAQLEGTLHEYTQILEGLVLLQDSMLKLTDQEVQLEAGIVTFEEEIRKAKDEIENGKADLLENQIKLEEGYQEFDEKQAKFNIEISDAYAKIEEAKEEVGKIRPAKWYIKDRNSVVGYGNLKFSTDAINSVARVFPVFFVLIVILMTSNTMARMIVEERSEFGTLISLGFTNGSIISTYLLYVLSATIFGSVLGFFLGCSTIPKIVYSAFYQFILPPLVTNYDVLHLSLISFFAIVLMTSVTIFFCNLELLQKPATLMRPVPPKVGQTIVLERFDFIWKHFTFTWKVTIRNIFRYKQRVFMTIVGVSGCVALLITGFGIKDSINGVAQEQYGEIFRYKGMMVLKEETDQITEEFDDYLRDAHVINPMLMKQSTVEAFSDKKRSTVETFMVVPENLERYHEYFHLTNFKSGDSIELDDNGVIITEKLAQVLKKGKGDTLEIIGEDNLTYQLFISEVAQHYIKNYIYMSETFYQKTFPDRLKFNMIVADYDQVEETLSKQLLEQGEIINVTYKKDIIKRAEEGNASLNSVVIMIVVIALLLVIIVLYNLTSINISERKREIATLKVLGFTDTESNQYIYREAIILTLLSSVFGLLLGILLHRFIVGVIEGDVNVYFKEIQILSYVWTLLIVIAVTFIMQVVTNLKTKTIDMIESLKSVE